MAVPQIKSGRTTKYRWPVDFELFSKPWRHLFPECRCPKIAPPGHPKRCQGKNRLGLQCQYWQIQGSLFCKWHGGRQPKVRQNRMGAHYTKFASKALAERLAEMEVAEDERRRLDSEIDVARIMAQEALQTYDAVVLSDALADLDPASKAKYEARITKQLRDSLDFVGKMITAEARVREVDTGIPVANFKIFLAGLEQFIARRIEPLDKRAAKDFVNWIQSVEIMSLDEAKVAEVELRAD